MMQNNPFRSGTVSSRQATMQPGSGYGNFAPPPPRPSTLGSNLDRNLSTVATAPQQSAYAENFYYPPPASNYAGSVYRPSLDEVRSNSSLQYPPPAYSDGIKSEKSFR